MGELDIAPVPGTLPPKEKIVGEIVQDMEIFPKKSTTRPYSIWEKVLMALGEVDICPGLAHLPPIIQVIMLDHLVL